MKILDNCEKKLNSVLERIKNENLTSEEISKLNLTIFLYKVGRLNVLQVTFRLYQLWKIHDLPAQLFDTLLQGDLKKGEQK